MNNAVETGPSTTRIEAFSDGVLAIVITLMVLEIKIPAMAEHISNGEAWQSLHSLWPKLLSYALSFIMVAIFWANHHQLFHSIKHATRSLLWLNNAWLFFICLLPFPTAFLGEHPSLPLACSLFGAELFLCALFFFAIRWSAYKFHVQSGDEASAQAKRLLQKSILAPIFYLISAIVGWFSIYAAYTIFIVMPVVFIFSNTKKVTS
jgi:uncharacterized membrane protein